MGSANDAKQRDPPRDEVRRESERMSSPRPQIAKQNRTRRRARTGKGFLETAIYKFEKNKSFAVSKKPFWWGVGELYSVLPPDEDAIWQSEVRLKWSREGCRRTHHPTCL